MLSRLATHFLTRFILAFALKVSCLLYYCVVLTSLNMPACKLKTDPMLTRPCLNGLGLEWNDNAGISSLLCLAVLW